MRKLCIMCNHASYWHNKATYGPTKGTITCHAYDLGCQCKTPVYNFSEYFYSIYLPLHSRPATKFWHLIGVMSTFAFILLCIYTGWYVALALSPFIVYLFAWPSHLFIEHNKPAAFSKPLDAKAADLWMCFLLLTFQLKWNAK
jgi:hypothetical protein